MRFFEKEIMNGQRDLFYRIPGEFSKYTNKNQLRYCVGAALYMPATREVIAEEIIAHKHPSLTTIVLDLEDALGDLQVSEGIEQLKRTLTTLKEAMEDGRIFVEKIPLLFVRVRSADQLHQLTEQLGNRQHFLTGYVLPKFTSDNGRDFLQLIKQQNQLGFQLYGMPILESGEILLKEKRLQELLQIRDLLQEFEEYILNVRIGSTDFCGLLGVRRSIHHTVYDIQPVRDCITDILNVFLRDSQFVLSGSVWEYFNQDLAIKGLEKEIELDRLNGLIGKTIIHPTHIKTVQAMYVVSHEDYLDAERILLQADGSIGVEKSAYGNKMNEIKPHYSWAQRTMMRAEAFGVFNKGVYFTDLLGVKVQNAV
ncbi:HpcH/HpaI aldolase/citrate lyase family protein [Solibacillus isronensis]|uniref:HpcH/HpaI aldolase/citrate lyase family protein n=1 Tax=Solibacillus isronensis TaxID=412383 RepID=UPI00333FBDCD